MSAPHMDNASEKAAEQDSKSDLVAPIEQREIPDEKQPQLPLSSESLTYFEKQRDLLVSQITASMELILNEMNALNRSLENSVAVGKEFENVSTLWDGFYKSDLYNLSAEKKESNNDPATPR